VAESSVGERTISRGGLVAWSVANRLGGKRELDFFQGCRAGVRDLAQIALQEIA
jgi:hypothetical protein